MYWNGDACGPGIKSVKPNAYASSGGANGRMNMATIRTGIVGILVLAAALGGWQWWQWRQPKLPEGIAFSNGRIEADQVDIAAKYAGRVKEVLVKEGDLVEPGQVLARMDTAELEASLEKARAETARAVADVAQAEATILQRRSELRLAEVELKRTLTLVEKGHVSKETRDQRQSQRDVAEALLNASRASFTAAQRAVEAKRAEVHRIQTQIDDSVLPAPVVGRVLYRLAEPGEVLAAGGKVLTLINLMEIYMEIFLPSGQAHRVAVGSAGRIVLDGADFAIPAKVSFVSPEAQFTPKQVETPSEREKLMFRVKIRVPPSLVRAHIEQVKTGIRGVGYVRLGPDPPQWPEFLEKRFPGDPLDAPE